MLVHSTAALPVAAWSITTAFGVIAFALYMAPLRRRRDHDDRGLARFTSGDATAAAALAAPAGLLVAGTGQPPDGQRAESPGDVSLPPWLRRGRADPGSAGEDRTLQRFESPPRPGVERRAVTYRWVRVSDGPDERMSNEIGRLDRGDEVEVIGEFEGAIRIRTPSGIEGWVPRVVIVRGGSAEFGGAR